MEKLRQSDFAERHWQPVTVGGCGRCVDVVSRGGRVDGGEVGARGTTADREAASPLSDAAAVSTSSASPVNVRSPAAATYFLGRPLRRFADDPRVAS